MTSTTRRIILSCLFIFIAICICLSIIGAIWTGVIILEPSLSSRLPLGLQPSTTVYAPAATPTLVSQNPTRVKPSATSTANILADTQTPLPPGSTPIDTPTPPLGPGIPPVIASQMDEIQQQVSQLRGLQANQPVNRNLMTPDQLRQRVSSDFLKDYSPEQARDDAIELYTFGLLDPKFDLLSFYKNLLTEQVAGFYDNKTKEMYVIQADNFTGMERFNFSHEYDHFLQDQNFDIQNGLDFNDTTCKKESEYCAAIQALLEGDATVLSLQWLRTYATSQDKKDIQKAADEIKLPIYDSAPDFIKQDFTFPYQAGLVFVQQLYSQGGWETVNQAYHNPPVSTEQILHPVRYPNDTPVSVSLPDFSSILGADYREVVRNTLGEWYTFLVLAYGLDPEARIDPDKSRRAAEGWGGDSYVVYFNDVNQTSIMILVSRWDDTSEANQFSSSFREYATKRFGNPTNDHNDTVSWSDPGGYTEYHINGEQTTWIYSPTKEIAQAIWGEIQP